MSAVCSDMFRHLLNFLYLKCQEEERSRAAMCPLSKRHGNSESLSYTLLLQSYLSIFVGVLIHFYAFLLYIQRLLVKENMYVFHWTISCFRRIEELKHFLVPMCNTNEKKKLCGEEWTWKYELNARKEKRKMSSCKFYASIVTVRAKYCIFLS